MEQTLYQYYSTQRPIDMGTFPKAPDNTPTAIQNFDQRLPVEGGAFLAWGVLTYEKSLTDQEQYQYELRPSRNNPDVREKMREQARLVGLWELYRRVPEEKRVTDFDPASNEFVPRDGVTLLRMNAQYNTARKFPVPKKHPGRRKDAPCPGSR